MAPGLTETRPSELAALIRLYWEGVEAYNNAPDDWTTEQEDAFARTTFNAAEKRLAFPCELTRMHWQPSTTSSVTGSTP